MKLLLVEDDREIQEMLGDYLRTEAYEVVCASNGRDACRLFDEGGIGLVLLDLMLPGLTGEEFIAQMRQKKTMPIIVLSAKAGLEDKVNVLRLGADDFIPKPFDNLEVLARVEAQLRRVEDVLAQAVDEARKGGFSLSELQELLTLLYQGDEL